MKKKSHTSVIFANTVVQEILLWQHMLNLRMKERSHTGALFVITIVHRKIIWRHMWNTWNQCIMKTSSLTIALFAITLVFKKGWYGKVCGIGRRRKKKRKLIFALVFTNTVVQERISRLTKHVEYVHEGKPCYICRGVVPGGAMAGQLTLS